MRLPNSQTLVRREHGFLGKLTGLLAGEAIGQVMRQRIIIGTYTLCYWRALYLYCICTVPL